MFDNVPLALRDKRIFVDDADFYEDKDNAMKVESKPKTEEKKKEEEDKCNVVCCLDILMTGAAMPLGPDHELPAYEKEDCGKKALIRSPRVRKSQSAAIENSEQAADNIAMPVLAAPSKESMARLEHANAFSALEGDNDE